MFLMRGLLFLEITPILTDLNEERGVSFDEELLGEDVKGRVGSDAFVAFHNHANKVVFSLPPPNGSCRGRRIGDGDGVRPGVVRIRAGTATPC